MEVTKVITENWFTRPPRDYLLSPTLVFSIGLLLLSWMYFSNFLQAQYWMIASGQKVFIDGQWWRAWTTLFAHADVAHILSNALLFVPLVYLLTAYFDLLLFPWLGLFWGGITNLIVLKSMPLSGSLVGISGVVYWMGAVWLTLFFLIDRRKNAKARFANILFLGLMIFMPETYQPQVSYLCHLIGFVIGIVSALLYYWWNKKRILAAERVEWRVDSDEIEITEALN